jgi:hypothetical protein
MATPSAHAARPHARWWRWAGPAVFCLLIAVLFIAYLRLSQTYTENSDEANILLMADDMLHGNLFLSGWHVSDVPFITTELPQMALLVWIFGLHLNTAHIAAAFTYTLVVAVAMLLAKGSSASRGGGRGWNAVARMGLALGIMLVPQPGVGVFVDIFSVGHIGTATPVMLTWLVVDRAGKRWWVPPVVAVLLAWAETADPLVLVVAIFPVLAVCLVRVLAGLVRGARGTDAADADDGPRGLRGMRDALTRRWFELALAAAAGAGYGVAWLGSRLLAGAGGYIQQPVPYDLDSPSKWFMQARIAVHGLLEMFGAYFVPGQQEPQAGAPAPGMLDQVIAYSHLIGVVLALWGACAIARRFFRRDADFVSQLLVAGIIANVFAYVPSMMADHSALNAREIAPVLPFAAVLAGRMLGDGLLKALRGAPRRTAAGAPGGPGGRKLRVRVVAASLAVLTGWYGFGLGRQASAPPAPEPYSQLVSYLESKHLSYGIGGYWESSIITVESGGAVAVRAVTPACLQPYQWESKADWYDASKHSANFLLLNNVPGYFSKFSPAAGTLMLLSNWYPRPRFYDAGSHAIVRGYPLYQYEARVYSGNLLAAMPKLRAQIENPPPWLVRALTRDGDKAARGQGTCS